MSAAPKRRRASAIRSSSASTPPAGPARPRARRGRHAAPRRPRGCGSRRRPGRRRPRRARVRARRRPRARCTASATRSGRAGASRLLGVERLGRRRWRPRRARSRAEAARVRQVAAPRPRPRCPRCARRARPSSASRCARPAAAPGELLAAAARGEQLPPGGPQLGAAAKLLLADERVEHVELVRGPSETALLELAGHGEQTLDERREVLARDGAAPCVRTRPPVREHPPGGDQALPRRRAAARRSLELRIVEDPLREVELGLDVGLLRARARGTPASPGAPSRSPTACARIVLPAPVSPVTALSPGAKARSASRMRTKLSMRRRRSTDSP